MALANLQLLESLPGRPLDVEAATAGGSGAEQQQWQRAGGEAARLLATLQQHMRRQTSFQLSHLSLHPTEPPRSARCAYGPNIEDRLLCMAADSLQRPYYDGQAPPQVQERLLQLLSRSDQLFVQREHALRAKQHERPHQPPLSLPGGRPLPAAAPFERQPTDCHVEHAASQPVAGCSHCWPGGFLQRRRIAPMLP